MLQLVAAEATSSAAAPKTATAASVQKPPVLELQGKKWAVVCGACFALGIADGVQEYQKGNKNIVIDQTDIKQVVYLFKSVARVLCSSVIDTAGATTRRCRSRAR